MLGMERVRLLAMFARSMSVLLAVVGADSQQILDQLTPAAEEILRDLAKG